MTRHDGQIVGRPASDSPDIITYYRLVCRTAADQPDGAADQPDGMALPVCRPEVGRPSLSEWRCQRGILQRLFFIPPQKEHHPLVIIAAGYHRANNESIIYGKLA